MQKLKFLLYAAIYILGIGLLGLLNIAILKWDWSKINAEWFLELGFYNALYYSFFVNTLLLVLDKLTTDTKFVKILNQIEMLRPIIEGEALREFVDEANWYEKVEKHKERTIKKRSKLIKRKSTNAVSRYINYGAPETKNIIKKVYHFFVKIKANRFTRKLNHLTEKLTDEWIDNNLMFSRVVYAELEYSELVYGTHKIKNKRSKFTRGYAKKQVFLKIPMMMFSTAGTIIMTVMQIDRFKDLRNLIKDLAIILILLIVNILSGIFSAISSHKERTVDTAERLEMAIAYSDKTYKRLRKLPKTKQNNIEIIEKEQ